MDDVAWLTLALVVVTLAYTFATFRMATTVKRTFLAQHRPYLSIDDVQVLALTREGSDLGDLEVGLGLRNHGHVLIRYEVRSIDVEVNEQTVDNPRFLTRSGHVFPGSYQIFVFDVIREVRIDQLPIMGTIEYDIGYALVPSREYGRIRTVSHRTAGRLGFRVLDLAGRLDWRWLEDPIDE